MFWRRRPGIVDNPVFEKLMVIAKQDREVRERLISILDLPATARKSELTILIGKMRMRAAPIDFETAILYLLHDPVAATAVEFLGGKRRPGAGTTTRRRKAGNP